MARTSTPRNRSARKTAPSGAESNDSRERWRGWAPVLAQMLFMTVTVAAITPYTYNLDDIKRTLYLVFGSLLLLIAVSAMARGTIPVPPRLAALGLTAYALVMIVSTLASEYSWAGGIRIPFFLAGLGFYLGGLACGSTRKKSETYLLFLIGLVFLTNLFGFFQYDLRGSGQSGMGWLYDQLNPLFPRGAKPPIMNMLYTFKMDTKDSLMSTILNRDFYAAYCLLYLPMAVVMALSGRARPARALGFATFFLCLISIFLCQSKGEYFFSAVSVVFFIALYLLAVRQPDFRPVHLFSWMGGIAILLGSLLLVNGPTLVSRLKTVSHSVSSRQIIFSGAWNIFKDYPFLGSGPGTFTVFFPRYRAEYYFEYGLSNVTNFSHNYILDILSETGLAGGISYALFALTLAVLAFRWVFRAESIRLRLMLIGCLAGLLGMYGSNMTSPNARWPIGAIGLWTMLGFMTGLIRQAQGWEPPPLSQRGGRSSGFAMASGPGRWGRTAYGIVALIGFAGLVLCWREGWRYWVSAKSYYRGLQLLERNQKLAEAGIQNKEIPPDKYRVMIEQLKLGGEEFKKTIQVYPQYLSAYYKRGTIENFLGHLEPGKPTERLEAALSQYENLAKLAPDYSEIHYNFGVVNYSLAKRLQEKRDALPDTEKEQIEELNERIEHYLLQSLHSYQNMRKLSRREDVLRNLGDSYLLNGKFTEGQAAFRQGVEFYPDDYRMAYLYRRAAQLAGDIEGRVRAQRALWHIQPGRNGYLYDMNKGRGTDEAESDPNPGALDLALENGLDDLFGEIITEAFERNPVDPELYALQAQYASRHDDQATTLHAVISYVKLGRLRREILDLGLQAADISLDLVACRAFYMALQASPEVPPDFKAKAADWLSDHRNQSRN